MSQELNIPRTEGQPGLTAEAAQAHGNDPEELSLGDRAIALALQPAGTHPRFDSLLQAIGACVDDAGLDGVTIDDIAERSGLSRATIYRRFGTRDGMMNAFLARRSLNTIEIGRKIAGGPGDLATRLEGVLTHMISGVYRAAWMRREHAQGLSPTALALLQATAGRVFDLVVVPMLQQAEAEGEWRRPAPLDELAGWLVAETLLLMRMSAAEEIDVRRLVGTYIMPVLNLRASPGAADGLPARIEALRAELAAVSKLLQAQLEPGKSST